ncbi:MAG: [FeFe] hydrogenase H-cluster maturation GTPase HydF [Breznakibacter sp.]|nr:[FeFe] hydrogenase H-cluster maturation GTPase HydF [Breznakibacter sp.]
MSRDRRPHIGLYGRRNNGKSTLINHLTGQELAIVSETAGTTTDPVKKSMEITGFGPVIMIDTAGIDDSGELGRKRISKTLETIKIIDLAILVVANNLFEEPELELVSHFNEYGTPYLIIHNREDEVPMTEATKQLMELHHPKAIVRHHHQANDIDLLIEHIRQAIPDSAYTIPSLLGKIIGPGDVVLLVTPIDSEAPEGRMILPQVQAIRDVLDNDAICVVVKENGIEPFLQKTAIEPVLVVTDSQAFKLVNQLIPPHIALTSFSIMLANFKGNFEAYLKGTPHLSQLKAGDRLLILESCTHHVACDDIGRFKIPNWINKYNGLTLEYDVVSGLDNIKRPITDYAMVIQCGGCMITRKQLLNRLKPAIDNNIPVSNYGMTIAYLHGIFDRAVEPFVLTNEPKKE